MITGPKVDRFANETLWGVKRVCVITSIRIFPEKITIAPTLLLTAVAWPVATVSS